ncbi:MAG: glycosyltransferase [Flavobacteriaceae bacterium]|nr:glycosyltransferase [Flavobacteriaceae bacterium]
MKRIIVSVTNDLVTDQRVSKTCSTLSEMGYDILLIGRRLKKSLPIQRSYSTKRFRLLFNKGVLFYAEYNFRLFLFLLFSKKNILFSNDLDTLLPNYLISKLLHKELFFDSHELFSEIPELSNRPRVKKIWLGLEKRIIPKLKHVITVSDSIKQHYQSHYGITATVIRNLPITQKTQTTSFGQSMVDKKIILYQGAINIGRGLELMIETMSLLDEYLLYIIGEGDILQDLKEHTSTSALENKVIFINKKTPKELRTLTPNASVGISLEEDLGLNYRYALPNKVFDYIHANVPVIVSNLPEMKAIIENYNVGEVLIKRTPEELASLIKKVSEKTYTSQLNLAKTELNWDVEKKQLIQVFKTIN